MSIWIKNKSRKKNIGSIKRDIVMQTDIDSCLKDEYNGTLIVLK